ncbi:MAG TPA: virulence protein [Negativicutes bacterium]|nr:virulence protein [Negativicutes bacterium]
MQIRYNVTGDKRKAMVAVMRDVLQDTTRYLGAPSFAFQVGAYTIDKNGTVTCPDGTDEVQIEMLIRELTHDGFVGERVGELLKPMTQEATETPKDEVKSSQVDDFDRLSVEIPKGGMTPADEENLRHLVASKATLLKKALGTDSLTITEHADRIEFRWFRPTDDQAELKAYYQLVQGICELASTQKRVTATEHTVENEKYAFRCFLLRLGFIGVEYKSARSILLRNLSGNSSYATRSEVEDE